VKDTYLEVVNQIKSSALKYLFFYFFFFSPAVNKDELLQMVRFGAEMVFSSKDSTITDEDIDRIIAKGEEATAELDAKMKKFTEDAIKFKMDDSMLIFMKSYFSNMSLPRAFCG